jgi:AraC-like DNA-binding protein
MKRYTVKSLPVGEVIANLAEAFNTSYHQRCNYYKVEIPKSIGSGSIVGMQFESGLALLNYECTFYSDIVIEFTYDMIHPIKFIHCYKGRVAHSFEDEQIWHELEEYQNIIAASEKKAGHILKFTKGEDVRLCSIEIERLKFINKLDCLIDDVSNPLIDAIKDAGALDRYYEINNYNMAITKLIHDLTEIDIISIDRMLLKEGQAYLMLGYQWLAFDSNDRSVLDKYDFEMFNKIDAFIHDNISKSITLDFIERQFYTNKKSIQRLFRDYAGSTVRKYIQKVRLEKSLQLLQNPTNNVSDVVYQLGLKNRSFFTRQFRKRYNMTPKAYRQKALKSDS